MRKKGRHITMKTQKEVFEVLIVKWAVKVRISGNASSMAFSANWIHLVLNFSRSSDGAIFPTQH